MRDSSPEFILSVAEGAQNDIRVTFVADTVSTETRRPLDYWDWLAPVPCALISG
jgi:hypothetical protein